MTLDSSSYLIGAVGKDSAAKTVEDLLNKKNIKHDLIQFETHPTTQKLRILANQHYIGRVDTEKRIELGFDQLKKHIEKNKSNLCILSDYDKGALKDSKKIISFLNNRGFKVFVDPKNDFENYRDAFLVKPNRKEFIDYFGEFSDLKDLDSQAKQALSKYNIKFLLITLGSEGMVLVSSKQFLHLPSLAVDVFDVTGAGDTVIATLVSYFSRGASIEDSMEMANKAASVSVSKKGVYNVSQRDLI